MRRLLIHLQQRLFKLSVTLFLCAVASGTLAVAGCGLRGLASGSADGRWTTMLAGGELLAFALLLWISVDELNGRAAAFARTLPGGPVERLGYLESSLGPLRLALAFAMAAFLLAFAGLASGGAHAVAIRIAFGVVASMVAMDGALALTLALGRWSGAAAVAALVTGCVAIVHAVAGTDPTLAGLAGATAWAGAAAAAVPTHWALRPALMASPQVPSCMSLLGATALAVAMRLALLAVMRTLFLDPVRTQGGHRRPQAAAAGSQNDLRPRLTPPLPERFWITARLMAWHGDAILPRVLRVTLAGVALLALVRFTVPRAETRGAAELATLLGALSVIAAWASVARISALFNAALNAARCNRWARAYPIWSLYPVGPWATAGHQVVLILAIGLASGVPLMLTGAALFPQLIINEVSVGYLWMLALVSLSAGGIAVLEVINKGHVTPSNRALPPWQRMLRGVVGAAGALCGIGMAIGMGPIPAMLAGFALALGTLYAIGSSAWRIDRAGGYDIIEMPQVRAQPRLHC